MSRTLLRKKPQDRLKRHDRKPKLKRQRVRSSAPAHAALQGNVDQKGKEKEEAKATNGNGAQVKHVARRKPSKVAAGESKPESPTGLPSAAVGPKTPTTQPNGPLRSDLLARVRQSAVAVPDTKIAEVEEATRVLKRIVSRALGRGRGMDERERKAVLTLLCDEVKPTLLRYELVLEGLAFLERLRLAKTRSAVVSARLNLKGIVAGLATEGAPFEAVEDLNRRIL